MVKQYKFSYFAFLSVLLCLSLGQAQTSETLPPGVGTVNTVPQPQPRAAPAPSPVAPAPVPVPVPAPAAAAVPATTPGAPGVPAAGTPAPGAPAGLPAGVGGTVDPNAILNIQSSPTGKFEEHISICRSREYDKLQYQSQEQFSEKVKKLSEQTKSIIQAGNPDLKVSFSLLKDLIDSQDMKDADHLITSLRQRKLDESDTSKLNGFLSYSKRNYNEAINNFLKVINGEKSPNEEFTLTTMAEIYALEDNYYEASAIYEDLNKTKKNKYLPELCEMQVLNSLNADGETTCLTAATKNPKNPFPLIYAGITFREREDLKRARDLFRRANNIRPTEMGNVCMAELSMMENKLDEAVKYFKLSVTQSPLSARAVLGLAWAQVKALNYNDALETFRRACRLNPKYEVEIRKAYKKLNEDKYPDAEKFMQLASRCSG
jgi:tetratricopeptide (TPR) repeat protein